MCSHSVASRENEAGRVAQRIRSGWNRGGGGPYGAGLDRTTSRNGRLGVRPDRTAPLEWLGAGRWKGGSDTTSLSIIEIPFFQRITRTGLIEESGRPSAQGRLYESLLLSFWRLSVYFCLFRLPWPTTGPQPDALYRLAQRSAHCRSSVRSFVFGLSATPAGGPRFSTFNVRSCRNLAEDFRRRVRQRELE